MKQPQKNIHVGVTESCMVLLGQHENIFDKSKPILRHKLWRAWTSIGFYNRDFNLPVTNISDIEVSTHYTSHVKEYFQSYLRQCQGANVISLLPLNLNDANTVVPEGENKLKALFTPSVIASGFSYSDFEKASTDAHVVVVSPFAELMLNQFSSQNMEILQPHFMPKELSGYTFPYCFENVGPHSNSFETIEICTAEIMKMTSPGDTVALSCGSMGVHIAGNLHDQGRNVFYCGGGLQLYFGIMGNRWRERDIDPANKLFGSYLSRKDLWINKVPEEFVPKEANLIEGSCYW